MSDTVVVATTATAAARPVATTDGRTRATLAPPAASRRLPALMVVVAMTLLAVVAYRLIMTVGTWDAWIGGGGGYFGALADAFAAGQTHLKVPPRPELLKLADPYDPAANLPYRLHDALLYHNRYYLYWGPVPALVVLTVWSALGGPAPLTSIGDHAIVYVAAVGTVVFSLLLLARVRRALFPSQGVWTLVVGGAVVAFATPLPFMLARPAVYEAAILAGQCFFMGGIWASTRAFDQTGRIARRWLVASGVMLAAAMGCRISLALGVAAAGVLIGLRVLWERRPLEAAARAAEADAPRAAGVSPRQRHVFDHIGAVVIPLLPLGLPLVLGLALLLQYNKARFGKWTEFGVRYQLAGINVNKTVDELMSNQFVTPNLVRYLWQPLGRRDLLPYVTAHAPSNVPPDQLPPLAYHAEPLAGLVYASPALATAALAALAAAAFAARAALAVLRRARAGEAVAGPLSPRAAVHWVAGLLVVGALLNFAPVLRMSGSTMRYLADLTPPLAVAAAVGFWQLRALHRHVAVLVAALFVPVAAYTVLVGMLLGMVGYGDAFWTGNKPLMERLSRALPANPVVW